MLAALLAVFVALQIADIATTLRVLAHGGRELNPVVRWFMTRLGRAGGLLVTKAVMTAAVIALVLLAHTYSPAVALVALSVFCAGYVWVVQHNWRNG